MKNTLRVASATIPVILALLLFPACGGDDDDPGAPDDGGDIDCTGDNLYGPEGGTIEVTGRGNFLDGLIIDVPAGNLDHCRSLYVDEGYADWPPSGCIGRTRQDDQFRLGTGGEKPYDLELVFHFPVAGMAVGEGETPCAFGYDDRTDEWNVILPDSTDGTTMTVTTTYLDYWMWGKFDLDVVSDELINGAMVEQYGQPMWDSVIGGLTEAIDVMETLYADQSCATWTRIRDVDLPPLIETRRDLLVSYQSQIGVCGACDLFSLDFGLDLSAYLVARIFELSSVLWDLFVGDYAGFMPFLSHVDFYMGVQRFAAVSFIENQACSYPCVTEELGYSVYTTYGLYLTYLVTHTLVDMAIDNDFWVACP
ncbi:MAG: hypothetical protein M8861_13350 [marine benthic group bacterium]|nr:hypothetical protein [Gemmatimonadota bacterium]